MSALNATASVNAAGGHVNAVAVEPEQEKEHPKLSENHKSSWNQQLSKKTKRWKSDVLRYMVVTRAVSHFEMSALNAAAPRNAVGVQGNAVAVEPRTKEKKNTQNC